MGWMGLVANMGEIRKPEENRPFLKTSTYRER
jgi:hypothetical protein